MPYRFSVFVSSEKSSGSDSGLLQAASPHVPSCLAAKQHSGSDSLSGSGGGGGGGGGGEGGGEEGARRDRAGTARTLGRGILSVPAVVAAAAAAIAAGQSLAP